MLLLELIGRSVEYIAHRAKHLTSDQWGDVTMIAICVLTAVLIFRGVI